jgi:hypothetical protein
MSYSDLKVFLIDWNLSIFKIQFLFLSNSSSLTSTNNIINLK